MREAAFRDQKAQDRAGIEEPEHAAVAQVPGRRVRVPEVSRLDLDP
jgi:hypothetical protein